LKVKVAEIKEKDASFNPGLVIVQVGGREDSNVYIRMKLKAAEEIGMSARHVQLPRSTNQQELLAEIKILNEDPAVHGIIVQMPLDSENTIDAHLVTDAVNAARMWTDSVQSTRAGLQPVTCPADFCRAPPMAVFSLSRSLELK